ncbi:MAG: ATP-binding cassette domain-containing protein [Candidatus Cloacimonetes bacterium]|nr:ATP-binding cassette domain-containing protein [Candidatus Cloacimonadota bacterium]
MIEFKDFTILGNRGFRLKVTDLKIINGQFIQISGNNNTGKSLLMRTIAGEYKAYEGEILYNGIAVKPGSYKALLISSDQALLPDVTVSRNLFLPFHKITKRKKEIIMNLLDNTGLSSSINHPIHTLSRSEKKSLQLIRAVVQLPHYLLIDDYDTYFDNSSLNNLSAVFEYAAKAGTTLVITTKQQISNLTHNYIISSGVLHKL